jgi:hypothetical protein
MKEINRKLTAEEVTQIVEFAKKPSFTAKNIAIVMEIDVKYFQEQMKDESSQIFLAVLKGRLLAKAEFETNLMKLSAMGSSPAQALELKLRNDAKLQEMLDAME